MRQRSCITLQEISPGIQSICLGKTDSPHSGQQAWITRDWTSKQIQNIRKYIRSEDQSISEEAQLQAAVEKVK